MQIIYILDIFACVREIEPEEEVDIDDKGPYILQSEVEKLWRKWGIRRLQKMMIYQGLHRSYNDCFNKLQNAATIAQSSLSHIQQRQ